jgi:hypothetical protein
MLRPPSFSSISPSLSSCSSSGNFNYPLFIANNNTVDVYLYLASSDELIQSWTDLPNPEGQLAFVPDDSWWGSNKKADVLADDGANPWEAYFVIVPGGREFLSFSELQRG